MSCDVQIENNNQMQSYKMDQPHSCSSSSGALQTIPKSLPELPSISHRNDEIERKRDTTVSECNITHPLWHHFESLKNAFEGDTSTLFWVSSFHVFE